jgi:hypothetical protein
MMNKIIITLILLFTATFTFADGKYNCKKISEITPTSVISNTKTFEVSGLTACNVEADDEDDVAEYIEETSKATQEFVLLTEDLDESAVVAFK